MAAMVPQATPRHPTEVREAMAAIPAGRGPAVSAGRLAALEPQQARTARMGLRRQAVVTEATAATGLITLKAAEATAEPAAMEDW